jgi:flagellar biosynthesis protein FliQ
MLFFILIAVIILVGLALHLMQEAVTRQELSLMLAGGLVASASAALVGVYFMMGNYMGYVNQLNKTPAEMEQAYESILQYVSQLEFKGSDSIFLSDSSTLPSLNDLTAPEFPGKN